jgi:hypothetical protein
MWIVDFLKSLWAAYKAGKAAKAAADLPAGQASIDQIHADGDTIRAQMAGNKPAPTNSRGK